MEVDFDKLKQIVEGAIFAAAKPMTIDGLGNLFLEDVKPTNEEFKAVLDSLMEDYANRGVQLKLVSTGYRFQATEDVAPWVSRLWEEKPARYSRALLETLALIAYRQPITRGEIEEIRGVSTSSHIMKTLQEREWIRVVGHRDVPGRPAMYATTRNFLDYFNLTNIDELPSLAEIRDLDEINRELDLAAGDVAAPEATPQVEGQAESSEGEPDLEVEQEPSAELETDDLTQEVGEEPSPVGTNDQETEAETN
ncbi:MAG: SMC-Scp complex subunit ScpB [Pseudomonadales bacterium]|nr:SMC-Scp complex subunit ScpB [Pseudomonadales bacterium]